MFNHRLSGFEQAVVTIHPGEYFVSSEDIIISTVLGSCVSVSLWDSRRRMGGINHFMLPGNPANEDTGQAQSAKYGLFAMKLLYNELLKRGAKKANLVAKVFGGGSVLQLGPSNASRIPGSNVDFAFAYLEREKFAIVASDTGGGLPRKVFFFAKTGRVLLKRLRGSQVAAVQREEADYLRSIRWTQAGTAIVFEPPSRQP